MLENRFQKEQIKLHDAVQNFSGAMMNKLLKKQSEGYQGWDRPECREVLEEKLLAHVKRGLEGENLVDIANFCMMLWQMEK